MVEVDSSALSSAAQRIAAELMGVADGDPVHPPLGSDVASVGAAGRLTAAGSTLAMLLAEQTAGLVSTAAFLELLAAGFSATDAANAVAIATVPGGGGGAESSPVTGFVLPPVTA